LKHQGREAYLEKIALQHKGKCFLGHVHKVLACEHLSL
jgi:hypothetical protein